MLLLYNSHLRNSGRGRVLPTPHHRTPVAFIRKVKQPSRREEELLLVQPRYEILGNGVIFRAGEQGGEGADQHKPSEGRLSTVPGGEHGAWVFADRRANCLVG